MIARTESFVACSTDTPVVAVTLSCGLPGFASLASLPSRATMRSPTAFSRAPQLPSSAETSSPFSGTGQLGFSQEAPAAFFSTRVSSSPSPLKKVCHSGSTEDGLRA